MTIIDSSWYIKPAGIREGVSAGGVIVRRQGDQLMVALVREGRDNDYILPKGRVEPGESLMMAAQREIEEEAGLSSLHFLAELGVQERLNFDKDEWKTIHYYLYSTEQVEAHPTDQNHAYRCEWFPIDELPSMFWPDQRELIKGNIEKIRKYV